MGWSVEKNGEAPTKSDLKRGAGELQKFKTKVDGILRNLEGSVAGKTGVAGQTISEGALSSTGYEFAEAQDLFSTYRTVHAELERLSQTIGDQLECIGIAVHGADVGFDNLEVEQQRRFWKLQSRVRDRYEDTVTGDKGRSDINDNNY
ncbi:hypothetical protein [Streptomyces iconiensis]|uniref:Excreted virulence factor EspC, type VII ESX diderm n=1 Tax=Streptomyces iconiensis TaxID=1384038 RepID=A0ABT6ZUA0_9ACTN|nr:hypothetical protein [Streptomyces iconiensis]MDJ1132637.1 hypothetical protein [Streptomyces iconiensis]